MIEAADGVEALAVAAEAPRIALLVTDVVMPRMGGRELAERLREQQPGLRMLFVSGYSDGTAAHAAASRRRATRFIDRSFALDQHPARLHGERLGSSPSSAVAPRRCCEAGTSAPGSVTWAPLPLPLELIRPRSVVRSFPLTAPAPAPHARDIPAGCGARAGAL